MSLKTYEYFITNTVNTWVARLLIPLMFFCRTSSGSCLLPGAGGAFMSRSKVLWYAFSAYICTISRNSGSSSCAAAASQLLMADVAIPANFGTFFEARIEAPALVPGTNLEKDRIIFSRAHFPVQLATGSGTLPHSKTSEIGTFHHIDQKIQFSDQDKRGQSYW